MRPDMEAIVHEPGRSSGYTPKTRMRLWEIGPDTDEGPHHIAMRPRNCERKNSGARYTPFRRALRGMVGKPWDQVYSEICRSFSPRTLALKIQGWLNFEVARDCFVGPDGLVYQPGYNQAYKVTGFFVHPITGNLQEAPSLRRERHPRLLHNVHGLYENGSVDVKQLSKQFRVEPGIKLIDADSFAERLNGIWFINSYKPNPPLKMLITSLHRTSRGEEERTEVVMKQPVPVRIRNTRQMNSKELRRLGLRNM